MDIYITENITEKESKYSKELFKRLVFSLKYELEKTLDQISKEYNISYNKLDDINQGKFHKVSWVSYPIRDENIQSDLCEHLDDIIRLLKENIIGQKEIAKMYNVSPSQITGINRGIIFHRDNETYPLRQNYQCNNGGRKSFSPSEISEIEDLLANSTMSMRQIALGFGCTVNLIMNINNGVVIKYKNPNIKYPIRKRRNSN